MPLLAGGHYNKNSGYFHWFHTGEYGYFYDWDWYEPSKYDDAAIYLASGTGTDSFRWFTGLDGGRSGHPICEK